MSQGGPQTLLPDWDDRLAWHKQTGAVTASEILRGDEDTALVVVLASSPSEPSRGDLQSMWHERAGRSADPVLVAVQYQHAGARQVALLGVTCDAVPVMGVEDSIAERLLEHALAQTSPSGLVTEMRRVLGSLHGGLGAGFRNEGLFATHVLDQQPSRSDWQTWCDRSVPLLTSRGSTLLTSLGYSVDPVPEGFVLRDPSGDGVRRAAAVLLTEDESLDNPLSKFHGSNAVTHGLALARREGVPWLVLMGGPVMRLFAVDPDVGVGRKGQTQTYAEIDLSLLADGKAGYLGLLFAPDALAPDGAVSRLLLESSKFAAGLSERLRDRIYEDVIPVLATSVADRMDIAALPATGQREALDEAYHRAMVVLFRLLFVAYAEDRGLLPLDVNEAYTSNALKTLGRRILDDLDAGFSTTSTSIWTDLTQVWDVIDTGDLEGMGVPAYNGGLFTRDPVKNASGAATYDLRLTNNQIGPVLRGLLIDETTDGVLGMVDFRSLSVREFGTIYEGLLESGLGVATSDLTVDGSDTYVPAGKGDAVAVTGGSVYFHSRSGSRKATGSYFTKPFAVEHLLDTALEPALDDHLDRVKRLLDKEATKAAANALFDFRVADLSMGSAHFLVAAVDRIEARFSAFLIENPIPDVDNELASLRATAATQLGIAPDEAGIDNSVLLRRQIARRCIYGIDINEIAVELARLGIWIHTFVPGLPLSFLNHGLVCGNSLTGVGSLDEISDAVQAAEERETRTTGGDSMLLDIALSDFMNRAGEQLDRLAVLADASVADVAAAAEIQAEINAALQPLSALCDLITAERTTRSLRRDDPDKILLSAGGGRLFTVADAASLETVVLDHPHLARAREIASRVSAAHLPVLYAEVFRRTPPGFDTLLGNPPWEKLISKEDYFWAARFPGLKAMSPGDQDKHIKAYRDMRPDLYAEYLDEVQAVDASRAVLLSGPYPGLGSGHPDLFQAFSWRNWQLLRQNGRLGLVLPRAAFGSKGAEAWRLGMLKQSRFDLITFLMNTGGWVFDQVHHQFAFALVALTRTGKPAEHLTINGPYRSIDQYRSGRGQAPAEWLTTDFLAWSPDGTIPLLPSSEVLDVYTTMRKHSGLGARLPGFDFRPVQGDFNSTTDKGLFNLDLENPTGDCTVYKGASFTLWNPDTGVYFGSGDLATLHDDLATKYERQIRLKRSAFYGQPVTRPLPLTTARIAYRRYCNQENQRTFHTALVPPSTPLVDGAPYLYNVNDDQRAEAYLLGILSSIPFDWFVRLIVERNITFDVLETLPIPQPATYPALAARVEEISGRLSATDDRFAAWAREVGVPVGAVTAAEERESLVSELDALASLMYGLSERQVELIFGSFRRGWNFQDRLDAVLLHYRAWLARLDQQGVSS